MTQIRKIETTLVIPPAEAVRMYADIQRFINDFPTRIPDLTVAEFAEKNRVLPRGTPYPGPWNNARTPYLVEIMEALSASSPIREITVAKSAQVGATAMVENLIAYIIKAVPGPILYVTANEKLLNKWVNKRLSPLLISCGLDDGRIAAQHVMKGQRRTGNKMFSKEFPGGSLDMTTAGSAAGLRSDSIRYLIMDEVDGYPWNVDKEGDPVSIANARTKAWKKRKKILYISTPTTTEESHIWPLYEYADRRKYNTPCPHCGTFQVMEVEYSEEEAEGDICLKWETKAGLLDARSIYYECQSCREPIFEREKWKMVQLGRWEPTARSSSQYRRSYHVWSIASLMEDWESIVQGHIDSEDKPVKRRAFVNTFLGLPYREPGIKINHKNIRDNAGDYKEGTIPDYDPGPLFLTAAIDVQVGRKRSVEFGPRLELEVLAHGRGYRTWSILYKVFRGEIQDPFGGAWQEMFKWAVEGGMVFYRSDGRAFTPEISGIDSSDGKMEGKVFQFCQRWRNTFPIKGFRMLKKTTGNIDELLDEERWTDSDRFREKKKTGLTTYHISTNWYKRQIYQNLNINRVAGNPQRANFMDHPRDYGEDYYKMLTAEELRTDGTFYKPSSRRNEALDLKVYNMCLGEVWLASQVYHTQRVMIEKNGMPRDQVEKKVRTPYILDELERRTARLPVQ